MYKIGIDPGHGGKDPGAIGPTGLQEKQVVLSIALFLADLLQINGMETITTRTTDDYISLSERTNMLNAANVDLVLSLHVNSAANSQAKYVTCFILQRGGRAEKAAKVIQEELRFATGWPGPAEPDGIKTNNLHMVRETKAPAVVLEMGFISNPEQEKQLRGTDFQKILAMAVAKGVCRYFGIEFRTGTRILGKPSASLEQAKEWAKLNNAPQEFIQLADLYWELATSTGVDPVVAYVQFAHETGFLYRDGKSIAGIDATYHNPCGLKTTKGGSDNDPNAHQKFRDWKEGITAHIDHLALYAGAQGYPKSNSPDPRHFPYLKGTAITVEALGGRWSPQKDYGIRLVNMLRNLQSTSVKQVNEDELISAVNKLHHAGIISTPQYWIDNARPGKQVSGEYVGFLIKAAAKRI